MDIRIQLMEAIKEMKWIVEEDIMRHLNSKEKEEWVIIHSRSVYVPSLAYCLREGNMKGFIKTLSALLIAPRNIGDTYATCNTFGGEFHSMVASLDQGRYVYLIPKCTPLRTRIWHSFVSVSAFILAISSLNGDWKELRRMTMGRVGVHPLSRDCKKEYARTWYSKYTSTSLFSLMIKERVRDREERYLSREKDVSNTFPLYHILPSPLVGILKEYLQYRCFL